MDRKINHLSLLIWHFSDLLTNFCVKRKTWKCCRVSSSNCTKTKISCEYLLHTYMLNGSSSLTWTQDTTWPLKITHLLVLTWCAWNHTNQDTKPQITPSSRLARENWQKGKLVTTKKPTKALVFTSRRTYQPFHSIHLLNKKLRTPQWLPRMAPNIGRKIMATRGEVRWTRTAAATYPSYVKELHILKCGK